MSSSLSSYQIALIDHAMSVGALKFGTFTLKSGRISPYFFNAGLLSTGPILTTLSTAYAATLATALSDASNPLPAFDVIFGPAYKGIPFAACTAMVLHSQHHLDVGFAYDRKEAKDHGEGGMMVGVPVSGKRVVILDDVMTAGTAIRSAIDTIKQHGGEVVGVVQCLDRQEVGKDGVSSTVKEIEAVVGKNAVRSIFGMADLMLWLAGKSMTEELEAMKAYRERYGVKG